MACFGSFAAGSSCGGEWTVQTPPTSPASRSRVVVAQDAVRRNDGYAPDPARLLALLDRALQVFSGRENAVEAWQEVVKPGEVVGLKVNCLAGKGLSTNRVLVNAVCERLRQAGVRDIVIWDRLNQDLEAAGFKIIQGRSGLRCYGNDTAGYEEELAVYGNVGSLLSTTLTRTCNAIINLPVLKDHGITGFTGALKNLFGAIHNPNKYHPTAGNPYIADVNMLPPIRQKVRLTIFDAITAQYEGGPSFMPHWTWPYNGLIVGKDPVALDHTAWQLIEKKRAEMGLKPLREVGREPAYIATAADAQHRLGNNDPGKIELLQV
jgi:uncharacterized protein (DUF362 family)